MMTICLGLMGQTLHRTTNEKGRIGYADEDGNIIIKCKYMVAEEFANGVACVSDDGEHYGYINERGKEVLGIKYDEIRPFRYGVARVRRNDKWGLIDDHANLLLKADYEFLSEFNCYGKAWVNKGGKFDKEGFIKDGEYGIIDLQGTLVIPCKYKRLMEFGSRHYDWKGLEHDDYNDQLDRIGPAPSYFEWVPTDTLLTDCEYVAFTNDLKRKNNGAGLLDKQGNILVKEEEYDRIYKPAAGMMAFYQLKGSKMQTGYLELGTKRKLVISQGKVKLKKRQGGWMQFPDSVFVEVFRDNIALVHKGNSVRYFIDRDGNRMSPDLRYAGFGVDEQHPGVWLCHDGNTYAMYSFGGDQLIPFGKYSHIDFFDRMDATDLFPAKYPKGKYGVIDRKGNTIIPFEYDTIYRSRYGIFPVKVGGKFGFVNSRNETVIPVRYEGLAYNRSSQPRSLWVKDDEKMWHCYDVASQRFVGDSYLDVYVQGDGKYTVAVLSSQGLQDRREKSIVEYYPSSVPKNQRGLYCVLVNEAGEEVFSSPFPLEQPIIEHVIRAVEQNGGRPVTYGQAKSIILRIGALIRHHNFGARISENDWDY